MNENQIDKKEYLLGKLKQLSSELVTDPEKIKDFADRWRNGFHVYSFHNLLLIWAQKHEATICAGFNQWKKNKRHVKKGEKAIWIMAPGFKSIKKEKKNEETGQVEETEEKSLVFFFPVCVFDISQTDGEPLSIGNQLIKGNGNITIEEIKKDFPEFQFKISNGLEDGSTDGNSSIKISQRDNPAQMVCAAVHEIAHILCDHGKKDLSSDIRELEAEATAYLVCSCLEIENEGSKFYIAHWRGDKTKISNSSLKILSVSEKILKRLKPEKFEKREEA